MTEIIKRTVTEDGTIDLTGVRLEAGYGYRLEVDLTSRARGYGKSISTEEPPVANDNDERLVKPDSPEADLLEAAWSLLANVDEGNGMGASGDARSNQTTEWRAAADRWRDNYHTWLAEYLKAWRATDVSSDEEVD